VKKEDMLPAHLYLKDVTTVYNYLKKNNIDTWLWGDMLIGSSEFPSMFEKHLHGDIGDYGRVLREKIPREIVICDWHYFGGRYKYPSTQSFVNEGFKTLIAIWKHEKTTRRFVAFAKLGDTSGFIATTWWHVQKKEWQKVYDILKQSIEIFDL